MKLNLRYFVTAVAMLACAFCGTSCNDDDDDNGPTNNPAVTIADADAATENSLSFIITPSDAEVCSYICQEADKAAPSAEEIITRGRSVSAETATTAKARNLNPNTDYTIYAAAEMGQVYSTVARLTLTTLEHQVIPSVAVVKGAVTDSSATFTVTPTDAEKCAYVVVKKGETVPDAATILADGTAAAADKASEVTVEELADNTEYIFAVAVSHGQQTGEVSETAFKTEEKEKIPTVSVEAYLRENAEQGWTKWSNVFATIKLTDAVSAKVFCYATATIEALIEQGDYDSYEAIVEDVGEDLEAEFMADALTEKGVGVLWSNRDPETSYTVIVAAKGSKGTVVEAHAAVTTEAEPLPDPVQSELFAKLEGNWTMTAQGEDGEVSYNVTIAQNNSGVSYRDKNQLVVSGPIIFKNFYNISDLIKNNWPAAKAEKDWGPKFFLQIAEGDQVSVPADRNQYFLNWNSQSIGKVYLLGYYGGSARYVEGSAFPVTVSADYNTITIKPYTAEGKTYYAGVFNNLNDKWGYLDKFSSDIVLTRGTTAAAPAKAAPSLELPKFDSKSMLKNDHAVRIEDYKLQSTVAPFIAK